MLLLSKTYELGSQVKWSIYYENEMKNNPTVEMIKRDLDYLKKWFAWHPAFAHIDGKPVIFVYNEDDCDVAVRFMEAANGEWHVVLKLFSGDEFCPTQPSGWHQYSPMRYAKHYDGHSYSVSAGFWHAAVLCCCDSGCSPRRARQQFLAILASFDYNRLDWTNVF